MTFTTDEITSVEINYSKNLITVKSTNGWTLQGSPDTVPPVSDFIGAVDTVIGYEDDNKTVYVKQEVPHKAVRRQRETRRETMNTSKVMDFDVNGKTIKTNLDGQYVIWNGNDYPQRMSVKRVEFGKTTYSLFDELVAAGYTYIRFVEATTAVRGYHNVYAFCR